MKDKMSINISNNQPPKEFTEYLYNLIEEIIVKSESFDKYKKWLKKYCDEYGIDYVNIETEIVDFIELIDEYNKTPKTFIKKSIVKVGESLFLNAEQVSSYIKQSKKASDDLKPKKQNKNSNTVNKPKSKKSNSSKKKQLPVLENNLFVRRLSHNELSAWGIGIYIDNKKITVLRDGDEKFLSISRGKHILSAKMGIISSKEYSIKFTEQTTVYCLAYMGGMFGYKLVLEIS